jgi:hypothetical protein
MTLQDWIKNEGRPITERDLQRLWDAATFDGVPEYASWRRPEWASETPQRRNGE